MTQRQEATGGDGGRRQWDCEEALEPNSVPATMYRRYTVHSRPRARELAHAHCLLLVFHSTGSVLGFFNALPSSVKSTLIPTSFLSNSVKLDPSLK